MKKTLYEILGVAPGATDAEIQAAYQRLMQRLESGEPGLDHAEANFQLSVLKQAYWTISDNMRRWPTMPPWPRRRKHPRSN